MGTMTETLASGVCAEYDLLSSEYDFSWSEYVFSCAEYVLGMFFEVPKTSLS